MAVLSIAERWGWAASQLLAPEVHAARQCGEVGVGEDLAHEAQVLAGEHLLAIAHGDAGGLLAAVLQGTQGIVGETGHIAARGPDAEDAAFLLDFFRHDVLSDRRG